MHRALKTLVSVVAASTILAGCGLIQIDLPEIDLTEWFASGGPIVGDAIAGTYISESTVPRVDGDALGRGGLTLAGLSVGEGLVDMNVPVDLVGIAEATDPKTLEVAIFLSATPFADGFEDGTTGRLVRATIALTDNGDGTYSFAGPLNVGPTNDGVLDIAVENDPFYAALVIQVLNEAGETIVEDCTIEIDGLVLKPKYVL